MTTDRQSTLSILLVSEPELPVGGFSAAETAKMVAISIIGVDDADEMDDREWRDALIQMAGARAQSALLLAASGPVAVRASEHPSRG
jgi:hypothetical protein